MNESMNEDDLIWICFDLFCFLIEEFFFEW